MNKRGIETATVIELILVVLSLVALSAFIYQFQSVGKEVANKNAVQAWVLTADRLGEGKELRSDRPPVAQLQEEPIFFNTKEDLRVRANQEIADAMLDCSSAFFNGKINFLNKLREENQKIFCYPCYTFSFSDKLKKDDSAAIIGLNKFLTDRKPIPGKNNPTYLELLSEDNEVFSKYNVPASLDKFSVKEDFYVFFVAADQTTKQRLIGSIVAAGVSAGVVGGVAGSFVPLPIVGTVGGFVVGATIGAGGAIIGTYKLWTDNNEFESTVLVAGPDYINNVCNDEFEPGVLDKVKEIF